MGGRARLRGLKFGLLQLMKTETEIEIGDSLYNFRLSVP